MDQRRITSFFPRVSFKKLSPDTKSQFLELPVGIRRRIYQEAGLFSGKTIHMNTWAMRKTMHTRNNRQAFDHTDDSNLPCLPLSLFVVCRLVNDEVTRIFYGENQFAITRRARRGLRALERLRDSTLARIRWLIIRFNLASCSDRCCGNRERRCGNSYGSCSEPWTHDVLLNQESVPDQLRILQWQQLCTRLSKSIQPRQLALYVICDCEDRRTADMIVKPLLTLPVLNDFALRLARDYDKGLRGVVEDTVLRLTGHSLPPGFPPFRFFSLPKEIQLNVLEHTSLGYGYDVTCGQNHMQYGGTCSVTRIAPRVIAPNSGLSECFCCKGHSAFNFRCDHGESLGFPHAFFLVSREFRDAAIEVLYRKNSFAVSMIDLVPSPAAVSQVGYLSIIPGLAPFPRHALRFFTSLRFDFMPSELELFRFDRAGWKTWLETVDLLLKEANLAALNLEIRLSEPVFHSVWDWPTEVHAGYEERMWDAYSRLVQPVTALKGLKNFFVHMNWSTSCGFPGKGVPDGRQELEQKLERIVMGPTYDAWKCGKEVRIDLTYCDY